MTEADPFNLERFVTAQAPVFEIVLAELRAGRKRSHWMWFVFPQLTGLGRSSTARFYGIGSLDESRAYLAHSVLGSRLDLCTRIVLASQSPSLHAIFGSPDDLKFPDALRALHPGERIYTFWKYFRNAFARDAGLRIDHLLLSPPLAKRLISAGVDREVRGREHASDHAPAWIELAEPTKVLPERARRAGRRV